MPIDPHPTQADTNLRAKMMKNVKTVLRHPQLLIHFYENDVELSRRHVSVELSKAQSIYAANLASCKDPDDAARLYLREIPCYRNSYLYAFVRNAIPNVVVETGVRYGASSAFLLQALHDNRCGHMYSIDLPDTKYARDDGRVHHDAFKPESVGCSVPMELRDRWTLIVGDAKEKLPELLGTLESIDMFVHDSMHTYDHMYFEYKAVWSKLKTGGVLASDDVGWNKAFSDFCHEKNVQPHIIEGKGFTFKE